MSIHFQKHTDGVAVLTIDVQGRSANVLDAKFAVAFGEALARIEVDSEIKGMILTSGKRDFSVGADLAELRRLREPRQAFRALREDLERVLRTLGHDIEDPRDVVVRHVDGGDIRVAGAARHRQ